MRILTMCALAAAAATLAAGCGGGGRSGKKANETYANNVCTAIAGWKTEVTNIATDVSHGISRAELKSKATQVESATKDLVKQIKAVPPPDTDEGKAAKQQLDELSLDVTTTVDTVKSGIDSIQNDSSAGSIAAVLIALAPQLKSLASTATSTVSSLQSASGDLASAFQSTSSCKSLGSA